MNTSLGITPDIEVYTCKNILHDLLLPLSKPLSVYSKARGLVTGGPSDGNVLGKQRADLHLQTWLIHNR